MLEDSIIAKLESIRIRSTEINEALAKGEIINPNRAMNRTEAIAKLKESKDLLELDMMTAEEYESIKKELTPIIKGI